MATTATRIPWDGNIQPGEVACLFLTTHPPLPHQPVYRHRSFDKLGPGSVLGTLRLIGQTDHLGVFTNCVTIPNDSSLFGSYRDKYCVGAPNDNCSSYVYFRILPWSAIQAEEVLVESKEEEAVVI